jgi:hypothetical protein
LHEKHACGLQPVIVVPLVSHVHPAVRAQASSTFFIDAACAGVGSDADSARTVPMRAAAATRDVVPKERSSIVASNR